MENRITLAELKNEIQLLEVQQALEGELLKEQFYIVKNECLSIKNCEEYDLLIMVLAFIFNEKRNTNPYERGIHHGIICLKKIIRENNINFIFMAGTK